MTIVSPLITLSQSGYKSSDAMLIKREFFSFEQMAMEWMVALEPFKLRLKGVEFCSFEWRLKVELLETLLLSSKA